ncbi:hypothetical protein HPP92_019048 [Vanilla planifolia]|uniref:Uncharacterized protein n=1 Tax=Vanilla planifolia TaxID=51239 RepID=A0A835UMZ1_VANPL|nr:hypothetical protein HPP92_019048 [Vanilla planifolia]
MGTSGIDVEPAAGGVKRGGAGDGGEVLDLFLRRRGTTLIGTLGESGEQNGRIKNVAVGPAITGRSRMDDLLDADMGKHDYDWLLTPPGTPVIPLSNASGNQITSTASKDRPTVRSASTARASRLSASQPENGHSTRVIRSSSVVRPSISSNNSNSLSYSNKTSSLNTSTASVTSRPSTPSRPSTSGNRSASVSSSVSRAAQARSVNPAKTRPIPTFSGEKPRPLQNSRSSTPTSRPQLSSNSTTNSSLARSTSRTSTPSRRPVTPVNSSSVTPTVGRSPSAGRLPSNPNFGPSSRPSSPGPRLRAPVRPIDLLDFPLDAPPNLRTKLPERPASAGRTRPGMALTVRATSNTEPPVSNVSNRRPVASRNKLTEKSTKLHSVVNDHEPVLLEIQKPMVPELVVRRASKTSIADSTGFGRTLSKTSLDMALRHMDIRQNMGGIRAASLFPHSIRPAPKSRATRGSQPVVPLASDELLADSRRYNPTGPEVSISKNGVPVAETLNKGCLVAKDSDLDLSNSFRYDALLLKEDLKNTNWLHSIEDHLDHSSVFDHRFEPVPEPFSPF